MDHFRKIYQQHADLYDRLVRREDFEGNLSRALAQSLPGGELRVAELGAGTGRLTEILAPSARWVTAFDAALPMLNLAQQKLSESRVANCRLAVAENSALPLADASVDLAAAGWSIGHITGWYPDDWEMRIKQVLAEMERVILPGGSLLIVETLGTGVEEPAPPPSLLNYYSLLKASGFDRQSIRTDYRFSTREEAEELLGFFFGNELAAEAKRRGGLVLPECTGLWIRQ